jgi:tetratricopeptide (TPR) repeat protein
VTAYLVVEEVDKKPHRFAFRHALTREAIVGDLLGPERVLLHPQVATAARTVSPAFADLHLDDLAYHFAEGGVWDEALAFAQLAGERAQRLYAPRAAVEHFTRALDAAWHLADAAASPPDATRAALHRARGQAYETLGDLIRARRDYEAAVALARTGHDVRLEWQALVDLGLLCAGRNYAEARTWFDRALDLARRCGDPSLIAHSLNRMGNWYANASQPRAALTLHREALGRFEASGDRRGIAATLDLLGMASFLSADLAGSMHAYERAAALYEDLDDRQGLVTSLAMLCDRGGTYELDSRATG